MFKEAYCGLSEKITPDAQLIANTLAQKRVSSKVQTSRTVRFVAVPTGAVASLVIAFILSVNLSPAFASAMEQIPGFRTLAAAVSFSPSLSEAVKQNYVQAIGQEQTVDDITLRIEYIIVDQQQLHIFYTLHSERYEMLFATGISLFDAQGIPLRDYTFFETMSKLGYFDGDIKHDDLQQWVFDFADNEIPDEIILECGVFDLFQSGSEPNEEITSAFMAMYNLVTISDFSIPFSFDPELIQHSEAIPVNHEFSFDGQSFTITTVEISPTLTRVNFTECENNTAWLMSMSCYLIDENGNRFDQIPYVNDPLASQSNTWKNYLESVYFAESRHLTLIITDAVWLDKDAEKIRVDLVSGEVDDLPPGVEFIASTRLDNDLALTFTAPKRTQKFYDPLFEDMGRWMYSLFKRAFYDETGSMRSIANEKVSDDGYEVWRILTEEGVDYDFNDESLADVASGFFEFIESPGVFGVTRIIKDYPYNTLYLMPSFSGFSALEAPIEIIIR